MKLTGCLERGIQPWTDSKAELVRFDVDYFAKCLGSVRETSYSIVQQPDVMERSRPQPDYLLKDEKGNVVVVEHARFFESQERREHEAVVVKRHGIYMDLVNFPTSEELGKRLSEFFDDKLSKGQFAAFADCERILLARNRWGGVSAQKFLQSEPYFNPSKRGDCDHFYLIVQEQLIEVF